MPLNRRPIASRCVYRRRSARFVAVDSTGMLRFNVPAARFVSTGSAIFDIVRTQYWRSVSVVWAEACARQAPRLRIEKRPGGDSSSHSVTEKSHKVQNLVQYVIGNAVKLGCDPFLLAHE